MTCIYYFFLNYQEVSTRWNSTYYMLERILKQQQPICATLLEIKKKDLMPSHAEVTAMETFVEVMEPIVKITEAMGGQKWVTVSSVKPLLHQLSFKYLNIVPTDSKLKQ